MKHSTLPWLAPIVVLSVACAASPDATACDELRTGAADAAVTLLTDGASPAFLDIADQLADNPTGAFGSPHLGGHPEPGTVTIATYDHRGQVTRHGTYNLAGVHPNETHRDANARRQRDCLRETAHELPAAPATLDEATLAEHTPADLLRALQPATAITEGLAPTGTGTVIAFGFGRAGGDGLTIATADLADDENRSHILNELAGHGLLPDLEPHNTSLILASPNESIATGISAAGIASFAAELCPRLSSTNCTIATTLTL